MPRRLQLLAATLTWACSAAPSLAAQCERQSLGGKETWNAPRIGEPEWSVTRYVDLGDGKRTPVTYAKTNKGNGTLRIKNLELRTYRAHQGKGFTYSPYALSVELSTKREPNVCTLVVSGEVVFLDDSNEKFAARPLKLVYDYDDTSGAFTRVETHAPIPVGDIELSPPR